VGRRGAICDVVLVVVVVELSWSEPSSIVTCEWLDADTSGSWSVA
jgi:hypothetical protein